MTEEIMSLVEKSAEWRQKETINLIPSENVTSPAVRGLLSSDFGHRYTSSDQFYMGARFTDEIQLCGERLARDVFKSEVADLRPLSGHIADLLFLACFTKPEDKVLCISSKCGGYPGISNNGISNKLGLKAISFPFSKVKFNIRTDEAADFILKEKPRAVIFGASLFLFPHPVRQLTKMAKEVDATVGYDGSHVLGLIAGNQFQDPLREGASVLFGSTHKSLFGPQGGIILADEEHGETIRRNIYPAFVDNAHWNRIAALTLALAEMKEFGKTYARQVIRNAQALAKALADCSFPVVGSKLGFTRSHQIILDFGYKKGRVVAKRLEEANIIVDCAVRLGTCELTRRGMKQKEMLKVAEFINRALNEQEKPTRIKKEIEKFVSEFQEVKYCFK